MNLRFILCVNNSLNWNTRRIYVNKDVDSGDALKIYANGKTKRMSINNHVSSPSANIYRVNPKNVTYDNIGNITPRTIPNKSIAASKYFFSISHFTSIYPPSS